MSEPKIPEDCRYTDKDEWVRVDGARAVVGISDYAQDQLGDIVFVELPEVGASVGQGETFGAIESVKAVSDLYAPISGVVAAVNEPLADAPERVNEDCYGDGWLIAIDPSDAEQIEGLMDAAGYRKFLSDRPD